MKTLSVLLLASVTFPHISIPAAHFSQSKPAPAQTQGKGKGKWYLARTGHAVYCYGPVMTLTDNSGAIQRVATFCRGDKLLVPLKD